MPLDPAVKAYLESQAGAPPRSALSIEETRAALLKMRSLAGDSPPLAKIEDGAAGHVNVRLYWPRLAAGLPVMAYFHGGRFISGDLESHDPLCRNLAAAAGCVVVAAQYRLAPEHRFPAALEDCWQVAAWLADRFPQRPLAVCGDSAGGNLAAATSLVARQRGHPRLASQILIYPMLDATCSLPSHLEYGSGYGPGSDDMKRGWREYAPETDPRDPLLSPLWCDVVAGLPPALILTAEYDSLCDEGERYAGRLLAAGVPVSLKRYRGAIHGFFQMAGVLQLGRRAIDDLAAWLAAAPQ